MKNIILIPILLLVFNAKAINVLEAIKTNKITYQLTGNDDYVHYETPLTLYITNNSKQNISIEIDAGTIVQSNAEQYQDFVTTSPLVVKLQAEGKEAVQIYAMCIEQSNSAPNNTTYYSFTNRKNENLQKLTTFISNNKLFNADAQFLVWDLIENPTAYNNITSYKLDENKNIWTIENSNGKEEISLASENIYNQQPEEAYNLLTVEGTFTFNLAFDKEVHLAMFNNRNVVVKELYPKSAMPKGLSKIPYAFNSLDFPEDTYYIKLVMDGKVLNNREIDMKFYRN